VLRGTFEPKGYRNRHDEELRGVCSSPNIIKVMKEMRMRGAGHVTRLWGRVDSTGAEKGHEEDIREHGNAPEVS
jgi:hypothetical protein